MERLPDEGGFFFETYRHPISISANALGINSPGTRSLGTAIYYLVTETDFSALHRLKADEIFHFYAGYPAEMIQISPTGLLKSIVLGSDVLEGQRPQVLVPNGFWQGTRLAAGSSWALLGTTMFPAFDFGDFELANRAELTKQFPNLSKEIETYTREPV